MTTICCYLIIYNTIRYNIIEKKINRERKKNETCKDNDNNLRIYSKIDNNCINRTLMIMMCKKKVYRRVYKYIKSSTNIRNIHKYIS